MDEERSQDEVPIDVAKPVDTQDGPAPDLGLTAEELSLLHDLLGGRPPSAAGTDLLVDSINEKLFDLLGDTAVEFDADGRPALVEDYVEDISDALLPK